MVAVRGSSLVTPSSPSGSCVVDSAARSSCSCPSSVGDAAVATGSYPAREYLKYLNFTCADVECSESHVDVVEVVAGRNGLPWPDRRWKTI